MLAFSLQHVFGRFSNQGKEIWLVARSGPGGLWFVDIQQSEGPESGSELSFPYLS